MADSPAFDLVADELAQATDLARMEARGALRIVLKQALFDSRSVSVAQMELVVERLLPEHLRCYGVPDADAVCAALAQRLKQHSPAAGAPQTPDEIFSRLIRR